MQKMRVQGAKAKAKGIEEVERRRLLIISLVPGISHFMLGRRRDGAWILGGYIFSLWVFMNPSNYRSPPEWWMLLIAFLILTALFSIYSLYSTRKLLR